MGRLSIVREFFKFLKERKKYWLFPVVLFLILLGLVLMAGQGSVLSPFIYTIF